jgi:hypothetical protein
MWIRGEIVNKYHFFSILVAHVRNIKNNGISPTIDLMALMGFYCIFLLLEIKIGTPTPLEMVCYKKT